MQGIFRFARHVAFVALVARALMPMGWMPDAQAGVTICSVDAKSQHQEQSPSQDAGRHDICPFAAAPQLASTPDAPALTAPALHAFVAAADRNYAAAILARFTPGSPRAPPTIV
jgi:hypothetical protein